MFESLFKIIQFAPDRTCVIQPQGEQEIAEENLAEVPTGCGAAVALPQTKRPNDSWPTRELTVAGPARSGTFTTRQPDDDLRE